MMRVGDAAGRFIWVAYAILAALFTVACIWTLDRSPPIAVLKTLSVENASPGDVVKIRVAVSRDLSRRCIVQNSGSKVIDSEGYQWPLPDIAMPYVEIRAAEERTPGEVRVAFTVPVGASTGPATWQTTLNYICNPVHSIWPIQVHAVQPFIIIPLIPSKPAIHQSKAGDLFT